MWPITATHTAYMLTYGILTNVDTIARITSASESQNVHADGVCISILFLPRDTLALNASPELEGSTETADSIVYAALDNVKFIIAEGTITAEINHVVLNLRSPPVP